MLSALEWDLSPARTPDTKITFLEHREQHSQHHLISLPSGECRRVAGEFHPRHHAPHVRRAVQTDSRRSTLLCQPPVRGSYPLRSAEPERAGDLSRGKALRNSRDSCPEAERLEEDEKSNLHPAPLHQLSLNNADNRAPDRVVPLLGLAYSWERGPRSRLAVVLQTRMGCQTFCVSFYATSKPPILCAEQHLDEAELAEDRTHKTFWVF